jgi:hypothetical protein
MLLRNSVRPVHFLIPADFLPLTNRPLNRTLPYPSHPIPSDIHLEEEPPISRPSTVGPSNALTHPDANSLPKHFCSLRSPNFTKLSTNGVWRTFDYGIENWRRSSINLRWSCCAWIWSNSEKSQLSQRSELEKARQWQWKESRRKRLARSLSRWPTIFDDSRIKTLIASQNGLTIIYQEFIVRFTSLYLRDVIQRKKVACSFMCRK